ncbi:MAG TPA: hypothetical protein VG125_28210, partial [Pirellulales bacterium]|nr:hypothetical protein [Pirellulales bacterium]
MRPVFVVALSLFLAAPTLGQVPSDDNQPVTYYALRPGVLLAAGQRSLLESPTVRNELSLTDDQA